MSGYSQIGSGMGGSAITGWWGYTYIIINKIGGGSAVSLGRGILKAIDYKANGAQTIKVKIFRDDATNYVFIGETGNISIVNGDNLNIPAVIGGVEKNDLIGIYLADNNPYIEAGSAGDCVYKGGDITATSLKSGWSNASSRMSFGGKVFAAQIPLIYA